MRRMKRLPAGLALALAMAATLPLGGCVSFAAKPPPALLSLTSEASAPAGAGASGNMADALSVLEPGADASLAVLRVPVRMTNGSVAYLKKVGWVERPARQFQHLLAETLRAKGGQLVVEGDTATRGLKLGGRLTAMGYDEASRSVVVRFDAVKQWADGKAETRRFEHVVPKVKPGGKALGPALNTAANAVAREVADWVG